MRVRLCNHVRPDDVGEGMRDEVKQTRERGDAEKEETL